MKKLLLAMIVAVFALSNCDPELDYMRDIGAVYSTNGKIAFMSNRDGYFQIYIMNGDGTEQKKLTTEEKEDTYPVWSPDGKKIAFQRYITGVSENIYIINSDGSGLSNLTNDTSSNIDNIAWSPDGKKLIFVKGIYLEPDYIYDIFIINANGEDERNLTNDTLTDYSPAWSPDGSKIAFSKGTDTASEIYTINADGTGLKKLTTDSLVNNSPVWSPDGTKIAFKKGDSLASEIYIMNSDGTNLPNKLTNNSGSEMYLKWSPDGTKMSFSIMELKNLNYILNIFVINTDGSNQQNLTNSLTSMYHFYFSNWTNEGKKILYYCDMDRNYEIYSMNPDGTQKMRLTKNGSSDQNPAWWGIK